MRVLLCSYSFPPTVGGIETVSVILAREFTRAGVEVQVATETQGETPDEGYPVFRRPTRSTLARLARSSDVIFQNNISLNLLLPTLWARKPVVVTHQTWLTRMDGRLGWQDLLKRLVLRSCSNVSISRAIAQDLPVKSIVINNPYEAAEFASYRTTPKSKDIVFMGRLVSDKGCDQVLYALAELRKGGLTPSLTVIGDGEESSSLHRLTTELGLSGQVEFLGALREGRGREVARHKIMVVPSKWREPFGIVALEGIAAGCAVVASELGGLPEAVGKCGVFYSNGDQHQLASLLGQLLTEPARLEQLVQAGPAHLEGFDGRRIASAYLALFESLAVANR